MKTQFRDRNHSSASLGSATHYLKPLHPDFKVKIVE